MRLLRNIAIFISAFGSGCGAVIAQTPIQPDTSVTAPAGTTAMPSGFSYRSKLINGQKTYYFFDSQASKYYLFYTGQQINQLLSSMTSGVSSFNTRTGAVTFQQSDGAPYYPSLTGSYNNPAWINQLAFAKLTGLPSTLAGYGITDAYTQAQVNSLLAGKQNNLTLTTNGTGAATLVGSTLNIPTPVTSSGTVTNVSSTTTDITVANPTSTPALTLATVNGKPLNYFDPTSSIQTQLNGKQNSISYTPENQANKSTSLASPNNTTYPTTQAVASAISGLGTGSVTNLTATNSNGHTFTITNPTTTPNISLLDDTVGYFQGKNAANTQYSSLLAKINTNATNISTVSTARSTGDNNLSSRINADSLRTVTNATNIAINYTALGKKADRSMANLPTITNVAITSADSLLGGVAKLQGQINNITATGSSYQTVSNKSTVNQNNTTTYPASSVLYSINQALGTRISNDSTNTAGKLTNVIYQPPGVIYNTPGTTTVSGGVATVTTTLKTQPAHTFFVNHSGATATPTFAIPDSTDLSGFVPFPRYQTDYGNLKSGINSNTANFNNYTPTATGNTIYENFLQTDTARIGTIFNYGTGGTAITNIGQFVTSGSAFSVSSGKIIAAANNAGSIQVPYATALDVYVVQFDYRVTNGVTATNPLYLGFTSINTTVNNSNSVAYVDQSNVLTTYETYGNTTVNSTSGLPSYTPSDNMRVVMVYNSGSYLITVYDLTKGTSFSYSATTPFLYNQRAFSHNTSYPSITIGSGNASYEITNFQYASKMKLGGLWGDGDSLTYGISSGAAASRYVNQYGGQISAGSGDKSLELLARVPEIILTKAKVVYIMSGTNDPDINVWLTNVKSIVTNLQASASQVYLIAPPPNNNRSMQPFRDTLAKYYPNNYIDGYTAFLGSGTNINPSYVAPDGVHLNAAGQTVLANIIKSYNYSLKQNYYVGDIIGAKSLQNFSIPYFYNGIARESGIMTDGQNSITSNPNFSNGLSVQNYNNWSQLLIRPTKANYSGIVTFIQTSNVATPANPAFSIGIRYNDQNKLSAWRFDGTNQLATDWYWDASGNFNANNLNATNINGTTATLTNLTVNNTLTTVNANVATINVSGAVTGGTASFANTTINGNLTSTINSNAQLYTTINNTNTGGNVLAGINFLAGGNGNAIIGVVPNSWTTPSFSNLKNYMYFSNASTNGLGYTFTNKSSMQNVWTLDYSGNSVQNGTVTIGSIPTITTATTMLVPGAGGQVSQQALPTAISNPNWDSNATAVSAGATITYDATASLYYINGAVTLPAGTNYYNGITPSKSYKLTFVNQNATAYRINLNGSEKDTYTNLGYFLIPGKGIITIETQGSSSGWQRVGISKNSPSFTYNTTSSSVTLAYGDSYNNNNTTSFTGTLPVIDPAGDDDNMVITANNLTNTTMTIGAAGGTNDIIGSGGIVSSITVPSYGTLQFRVVNQTGSTYKWKVQ